MKVVVETPGAGPGPGLGLSLDLSLPLTGSVGLEAGTDETGQTVVYRAMVCVVTLPMWAGQLVTVGGHAVIVDTLVV